MTALLEALNGGKSSMEDMVASLRWFYPENMYADVPMLTMKRPSHISKAMA